MNWEWLINETTIARLLPDVCAHYSRPLQGALTLFLEGLPDLRQKAIAMEQATLPATQRYRNGWWCWLGAALFCTSWARPWLETEISPSN